MHKKLFQIGFDIVTPQLSIEQYRKNMPNPSRLMTKKSMGRLRVLFVILLFLSVNWHDEDIPN